MIDLLNCGHPAACVGEGRDEKGRRTSFCRWCEEVGRLEDAEAHADAAADAYVKMGAWLLRIPQDLDSGVPGCGITEAELVEVLDGLSGLRARSEEVAVLRARVAEREVRTMQMHDEHCEVGLALEDGSGDPRPFTDRIRALRAALDDAYADMGSEIAERDRLADALQSAHVALGGNGEWCARPGATCLAGETGDLAIDVPAMAAALRAERDAALARAEKAEAAEETTRLELSYERELRRKVEARAERYREALEEARNTVASSPLGSIGSINNTYLCQIGVESVRRWSAALADADAETKETEDES